MNFKNATSLTYQRNMYRLFWFVVLFVLVGITYGRWFTNGEILGGDWPYIHPEFLHDLHLFPSLWSPIRGNGLGGLSPLLNLELYQSFFAVPFVSWMGIPWQFVYKVGWFGLFLVLSIISPVVYIRTMIDTADIKIYVTGVIIFLLNTYILMLTSGGQLGVALAYSVSPLVVASFVDLLRSLTDRHRFRKMLRIGLVLGVQLLFDPRITYGTLFAVFFYGLIRIGLDQKNRLQQSVSLMLMFGVVVILALLLNAFWILPMVLLRTNPLQLLGSGYTSIDAVKFFSFADFSHALSLLHPNWPENIFGKIYFLRPEFLIIPVLAYVGLLAKQKSDRAIVTSIYAGMLGIIGVFLSKGTREPFGGMYIWMFSHIPGMTMFRDPTKFYVLTILAYLLLIPMGLHGIASRWKQKYIRDFVFLCFVFLWVVLTRQAYLWQLDGTFSRRAIPREYETFKAFLQSQSEFFRVLWVPSEQRFSFSSATHPSISASYLFHATNSAELVGILQQPTTPSLLADFGVKYIVIPFDTFGELFLTDRKYDPKQRELLERRLDAIPWLSKRSGGSITVYETPTHKDYFWLAGPGTVSFQERYPSRYKVEATIPQATVLNFSSTYLPGWVAKIDNVKILPNTTNNGLQQYSLPNSGVHHIMLQYEPERYVQWGFLLSAVTLLGIISYLLVLQLKNIFSLL